MSNVEIGPWEPGDEESICRLFERTFGRPRDVAQWRWQFLGAGLEPPVMVARDDAGQVVAHFGGVPCRAWLDGRERVFTVAVDSMVAPERRAGLKRRGLFATVVERWVDHFCERGPVEVGYGLANPEALRIGGRLCGYEPVGVDALVARALTAEDDGDDAATLERAERPFEDHDDLWRRFTNRGVAAACRDARFMAWRFVDNPSGYAFLGVRRRGVLAAAGVFKEEYVADDSATLVDLLWDGVDARDLTACVRGAERLAIDRGRRYLAALVPRGSREAYELDRLGYRPVKFGLTMVARSFRPAVDLGWLLPRFFFTAADYDLV